MAKADCLLMSMSSDTPTVNQVQQPKIHHYLPKFYSRAWCLAATGLVKYTNNRGRIWMGNFHPEGIGYREDLYRLRSSAIVDQRSIESRHFWRIDNDAALVVARIVDKVPPSLSQSEKIALARFMLALPARSPWSIANARALSRDVYSGSLNQPGDAELLGLPKGQTLLGSLEAENPHFLPDMSLIMIIEASDDPKKIARLLRMDWRIYDTSTTSFDLVFGDRPLLIHGNLLDDSKTLVAFPLSPHRLLTVTRHVPRLAADIAQAVKVVNRESTVRAVENIFATSRGHLPLARKHLRDRLIKRAESAGRW